jgi:hypothetical protein
MDAAFWELEKPFLSAVQLKKVVTESELVFNPDTRMKYSNIGFSLLGSLIEEIFGKPYNQYVRDHIFAVLGLSNTRPEFERSIENDLVTGYSRPGISSKRIPVEHVDTRAMSAATGLCSSAEELSQFYSALLIGTGLLLSDRSKREIQRAQCKVANSSNKYGLGVIIESFKRRKLFGHGGGFPGQKSYTVCDQKEELVIVAMTNAIEIVPEDIATGVLSVIDYFAKLKARSTEKDRLSHFQGTLMNMWRLIDIVVTGDKVVAINPNKWMPFGYVENLEYVDKSTLTITKAEGYTSEGEEVRFQFGKNGAITSVRYGGWLMWPEAIYRERLKGRNSLGLSEHQSVSR